MLKKEALDKKAMSMINKCKSVQSQKSMDSENRIKTLMFKPKKKTELDDILNVVNKKSYVDEIFKATNKDSNQP